MVLLALLGAGCMSTARVRPDADRWRRGVKTVAVLPSIRVYEVSAGEVREQRDDWSAEGTRLVADALSAGLAERGLTPRVLDPKAEKADPELREVRLLYEEVSLGVYLLAYPPFASRHVLEHFDYEVGSLERVLERARADALLVAYGKSNVSTTGRAITRALFGGQSDFNLLTVGLLDRKGHLVWFDLAGAEDLRDPGTVGRAVAGLLDRLPGEDR
ncbi:hypothetical protein AMYX_32720 [Anaeromyxobacter diazotrophicus]|uniref:Uncharacterized protein n=1 Tax=Anaeromyxobacter diazotrophicus TaxID=2590199 RepID=A0A7I9VQ93_9BACT|nr:hypothetical protein AMYX_32720 [Anaeromyxobacter diazotrophicus]